MDVGNEENGPYIGLIEFIWEIGKIGFWFSRPILILLKLELFTSRVPIWLTQFSKIDWFHKNIDRRMEKWFRFWHIEQSMAKCATGSVKILKQARKCLLELVLLCYTFLDNFEFIHPKYEFAHIK